MAYLGSFWIDSMPLFLSKFLAHYWRIIVQILLKYLKYYKVLWSNIFEILATRYLLIHVIEITFEITF